MKFSSQDEKLFYEILYSKSPKELEIASDLLNFTYSHSLLFSFLPGVESVAVCNSVSFYNPKIDSDIDLFFILRSKRFFTYRFIISLFFHFSRLRRHKKFIKRRFCLSFFVSDNFLDLSKICIKDDIYLYYWVRSLIFLDSNYVMQSLFKSKNRWIEESYLQKNVPIYNKSKIIYIFEKIIESSFLSFVEIIFRFFSLRRIGRKNSKLGNPTGVIFFDGMLKFHVKDTRQEIRNEFYRLRST